MNSPLVTTQWLAENLGRADLILLDASMAKVIGREPIEYDQPVFIPSAMPFDLEQDFCDLSSPLPHAFPCAEQFTSAARKLGIEADSLVVIYDNQGIYSAPRAWWMLKSMGLERAFVLDGGLPKWLEEGRETASSLAQATAEEGSICGEFAADTVCDSRHVLASLESDLITLVDARSAERFYGRAAEPRAGVRSGHIPGSQNLPFAQVLDDPVFKSKEELKAIFADLVPPGRKQILFSCGSGVTACILLMAAVIAGYSDTVLYDGSWADWGSQPSLPVATSE
ncbi:sulfurtransferase [Marinobacter salexigens]|uniref:sulfurtransferase n=1 Tax=Marinobacter salexigens TaxID=1925763 RepID=UPI000C287D66|nr:sulfurtransferase [Marinobacter salexigens]